MSSLYSNGGVIGKALNIESTERWPITPEPPLLSAGPTYSTTTSITAPSGITSLDVVFLVGVSDTSTLVVPSGWTTGQAGSLNSVEYMWAYTTIDPLKPLGTVTGLASGAAHMMFAFSKIDLVNIFDTTTPAVSTGTIGMPDSPSITTVRNNAVVLTFGFLDDDPVAASVVAPTGYTLIGATENGATVMAAYKTVATPATENPEVFTGIGTDSWVGATVALMASGLGGYKSSGIWSLEAVYTSKV